MPSNLCRIAPSAIFSHVVAEPESQEMGEAFGSISASMKGEVHVDEFTAQACCASFGFEGRNNTHFDVRERSAFLLQISACSNGRQCTVTAWDYFPARDRPGCATAAHRNPARHNRARIDRGQSGDIRHIAGYPAPHQQHCYLSGCQFGGGQFKRWNEWCSKRRDRFAL